MGDGHSSLVRRPTYFEFITNTTSHGSRRMMQVKSSLYVGKERVGRSGIGPTNIAAFPPADLSIHRVIL